EPAARRDVIAPRAPRSRLGAKPVARPAHRLCDPLYPDFDPPTRRRGQRDPRPWRGLFPPFRARALAEDRHRSGNAPAPPSDRRAQREDPLPRHRGDELQRPRCDPRLSAIMLETTIAGSLPKPSWLAEPRKLWPAWRLQGDALAEAKRDATVL